MNMQEIGYFLYMQEQEEKAEKEQLLKQVNVDKDLYKDERTPTTKEK